MEASKNPLLENEGFADEASFDSIEDTAPLPLYHRRNSLRRWLLPVLMHLSLVIAYTLISISIIRFKISSRSHGAELIYSPAREAVRIERHEFNTSFEHSPYVGRPSPELDHAWHVLMQYSNFRILDKEMSLIDPNRAAQSIVLPDGDYYGTLTAYHELHCLKRLHQYNYPNYYFPNISAQEAEDYRIHSEHCIDILRQGIMCHADISPITMRWGISPPVPVGNFSGSHECANWENIENWAKERQIPKLMEPGWLKHPQLGDVSEGVEQCGPGVGWVDCLIKSKSG